MVTARSHLNNDGAFLSHRHQPGHERGRRQACTPCDCLPQAQQQDAHDQASPLGVLIPLLIKYRHLPRRSRLEGAEPTYRTFYHTHKGGMGCEAKKGRGRSHPEG
jgi:hypothetical protein